VINLRLVERIDGTWCAFVDGQEEDAVVGPTDDAALGRLLRGQPGQFGVGTLDVTPLDPALGGELGRHRVTDRPDSEAPEVHYDRGAATPGDLV
jgi:hypothetical protein